MALRSPFERLEPPDRPDWKSQLTAAQFGPMAEDLLAVSLVAAAGGSGTVARPTVDRGIDLYLRRLRSLLVTLIQVKAFRLLTADGIGTMELPVSEVPDADGYLALVHLPAPYDQLYRRLFLVPFGEIQRCFPRSSAHGSDVFVVTVNFAEATSRLSEFAVDMDELGKWLNSIPGWVKAVPPIPDALPEVDAEKVAPPTSWESGVGRLWIASEIERVARGSIVIAEDRVRLDTLTCLIHDLHTGAIAGVHLRTQHVSAARTVHFEVLRPTFFVDARLYVLLLLLARDGHPSDFSLLLPSAAIPHVGFSETITIDPLTKKFAPYRVPTDEVAAAFLEAAFGSH